MEYGKKEKGFSPSLKDDRGRGGSPLSDEVKFEEPHSGRGGPLSVEVQDLTPTLSTTGPYSPSESVVRALYQREEFSFGRVRSERTRGPAPVYFVR